MDIKNNDRDSNNPFGEKDNKHYHLNPTMPPVRAAFLGVIGVFFLYQIGGGLLTILIFGLDFKNADINALRLLTMGGQVLLILLPALIFSKKIYEDVSTIIRVRIPDKREVIVFIIGLIILTPLLQNYLFIQNYYINQLADSNSFIHQIKELLDTIDQYVEQTFSELLKANSFFEMILIVLVVAVTPAVCEEVFFRGYVQKSFELQTKPIFSIIVTAAFFGLYHFNPYGLIALFSLGVYLGLAAYLSDSILIPIIIHFLNNLFAVIMYFIFESDNFMDPNLADENALRTELISFLFLLIVFVVFIYFVIKNYNKLKGYGNDMSEV